MAMKPLQRAQRLGKKFLNPVPTKVGGLKLMLKLIPLFLTNKAETFPRRPLGPFTTDPSEYEMEPSAGLRVTWMGHSSMLVEIDGLRILIDPVWDERASPVRWGGPRRFFAAPLPLQALPQIDLVLISHDHYDHLGAETVRTLARSEACLGATWVTSQGVGRLLGRFGVRKDRIAELDWTESVTVSSQRNTRQCELTAWPARHFSGRSAFNRFETLWSSFVIEGDTHRIYYAADTGWWEGIGEIAQSYKGFDLSIIEIGAFHELWKNIHLGPDGAIQAFQSMRSGGVLMPVHWGLFNLALHGWKQPIERIVRLAAERNVKLWAPRPGVPSEVFHDTALISGWWDE